SDRVGRRRRRGQVGARPRDRAARRAAGRWHGRGLLLRGDGRGAPDGAGTRGRGARRRGRAARGQAERSDARRGGGRGRAAARPTLDDFGHQGAIKQHADVALAIYREEMYSPGYGVEGATELLVLKNRNGPTGFVDLYFYRRWMRFEDMLDPDR